MSREENPAPTPDVGALVARLANQYQSLATSPLGMSSQWESKPSGGKPYLSGGRRGTLAYGTIGSWPEMEFIASLVNA